MFLVSTNLKTNRYSKKKESIPNKNVKVLKFSRRTLKKLLAPYPFSVSHAQTKQCCSLSIYVVLPFFSINPIYVRPKTKPGSRN